MSVGVRYVYTSYGGYAFAAAGRVHPRGDFIVVIAVIRHIDLHHRAGRASRPSRLAANDVPLELAPDRRGADRYIETKEIYPDAAELPSFTPNKPTMVTVLGPYMENDTKSFCCPDDTQYFNTEGVSYEYKSAAANQNQST